MCLALGKPTPRLDSLAMTSTCLQQMHYLVVCCNHCFLHSLQLLTQRTCDPPDSSLSTSEPMQTEAAVEPKFLTHEAWHPTSSFGVDCMLISVQETFVSRLYRGLFCFSDWCFSSPGQTGTLHYIVDLMALVLCLLLPRFHTSDKRPGLCRVPSLDPYASLK